MCAVEELVAEFRSVSLAALEERASLQRRVDNKYALPFETFAELLARLRGGHDVLEIDGRREFAYASTYFDTPDLRCFRDHVEDRKPRFKVRTRLYADSGDCEFEVKLKREDGETDKRRLDYPAEDRDLLTREAHAFLFEALRDAGLEPPDHVDPALTTSFRRATLAARDGADRLTADVEIRLAAPGGRTAMLREDVVLVETKSETGESEADAELRDLGLEPISLSKYRVGMALVGAAGAAGEQPGHELFERAGRALG